MYDTQFNHSMAPNNAHEPYSFRALFNGHFVIKSCIKHSKPFSTPIVIQAGIRDKNLKGYKKIKMIICSMYFRQTPAWMIERLQKSAP